MLNPAYWAMISALVGLAVAVASGVTYLLTHQPSRKHTAIITSATAFAIVIVIVLVLFASDQFNIQLLLPHNNVSNTGTTTSYTFDFESGIQRWVTSEGKAKLATVSTTTNPVHSGKYALQITTTLLGNANPAYTNAKEVYRHTEAVVYFNQYTLNGFSTPGPYNLTGKQVSCFVYLPSKLATDVVHQTYIRIFVKDTNFANDFSTALNIDPSVTNKWIQLSFTVGSNPSNADTNFDATKVSALGIRIETPDGSTLNYTGPFYIDDCTL